MTDSPQLHREYLELLPWYVTGTLAERDRARLERHLGECLPCNKALREERRLSGLVRDQDAVPLGPEHGLSALFDRIDRRQPAARPAARLVPWLGYGIAAALGGGIVWFWLALAPLPDPAGGDFATLSAGTGAPAVAPVPSARLDVVFAALPSADELAAFLREQGAVLVAGPSDLGRYTIELKDQPETALADRIETLRRDPRIRFAGRSYTGTGDGGAATGAAGGDR